MATTPELVKGIAGVDLQALAQRLTGSADGAEPARLGDGAPAHPEVAAHAVEPAAPTKDVPTPKGGEA
jgi:hypothetical protein